MIAVADVPKSASWYSALLNVGNNHPDSTSFDQLADQDGTVLLCLHHWGPSGPRGDHHWAAFSNPGQGKTGYGLMLWFLVNDFDAAWERAQALGAKIEEPPNTDNGTGRRAFVMRDLDGYHVAINEAHG